MVPGFIFVNAPARAIETVKITLKKSKHAVTAFFIFDRKNFLVILTLTGTKTMKILIFNFFFIEKKPVTITHQNFIHIFFPEQKRINQKYFAP